MKKVFTLTLVALFLLVFEAQSQKLFSLSEIITSDEVESTQFTYNDDQLLELSYTRLPDGNQFKDSLIYDDANNIVKIDCYQVLSGVWKYTSYIEYTYDENNNRLTRTNYNNFGGSTFEMGGIYKYTYDENNRLTYWEMYFAGDDNFSQCCTLTYNEDGLLTEELGESIDFFTGVFGNSWKVKYVYDENNNLVKTEEYLWDGYSWQFSTSEVYTFDEDNNCTVWEHYNGNNITNRNVYSYSNAYTYDQIVFPVNPESIVEKFVPMTHMVKTKAWYTENIDEGGLIYVCDFNYLYEDISSGIDNHFTTTPIVRIYPNPASEVMNIVLSGEQIISKVELVDVSGKNVYSQHNINRGNCSLDINNMNKGVYIVNIFTSRGVISEKVIIR